MKKQVIIVFIVISLILSVNVVSAFSFGDFFGNMWGKITGRQIDEPIVEWCDGADTNKDGVVNIADITNVQKNSGRDDCSSENSWCNGTDVNIDDIVNIEDITLVQQNFGRDDCASAVEKEPIPSEEPPPSEERAPSEKPTLRGEICGDGIIGSGEQCDDGNNVNDDGCSADCRIEEPLLFVEGEEWCNGADNNQDGVVNINDVVKVNKNFDRDDCNSLNSWCDGADTNKDGVVNIADITSVQKNFGRDDCASAMEEEPSLAREDWCDGADTNKDGVVSVADITIVQQSFGRDDCGFGDLWCSGADANKDGIVSVADITIVQQNFGRDDCISVTECVDSDDGLYYYLKGVTNQIPYNVVDVCQVDSNGVSRFVDEYHCSTLGNQIELIRYDCPKGCENGACIKSEIPEIKEIYLLSPEILNKNYYIGENFIVIADLLPLKNPIKVARAEILFNNVVVKSFDLSCSYHFSGSEVQCVRRWASNEALEGSNIKVRINVSDSEGNEDIMEKEFNISFKLPPNPELCEELIPGHNDPDANRANVVFVGFGYDTSFIDSKEDIIKDAANQVIDWNGNNNGLFSIAPFKDNKDKFNFWYVNFSGSIDGSCKNTLKCIKDRPDLNCVLSNKYITYLINQEFRSSAGSRIFLSAQGVKPEDCSFTQYCSKFDFDENGCVNSDDFISPKSSALLDFNEDGKFDGEEAELYSLLTGVCPSLNYGCEDEVQCFDGFKYFHYFKLDRTFVHEFGHQFGHLDDEYILINTPFTGEGRTRDNCYAGPSHTQEECLQSSQWSGFIGDGCGEEGAVDCENGIDENFDIEINCIEGCTYKKGIFRSAHNTIMRNHGADPFSFGKWNEHLIQEQLNKFGDV